MYKIKTRSSDYLLYSVIVFLNWINNKNSCFTSYVSQVLSLCPIHSITENTGSRLETVYGPKEGSFFQTKSV